MSGVVEAVLRGAGFALAFLFLLSLTHKARTILGGESGGEPVTQALGLHGSAALVALIVSAVVEAGLVGALAAAPQVGFAAAAAVVLAYTVAVSRLDPDEGCHCFGATDSSTRREALIRNVVLASVSVVGAALYGSRALDVAPVSQGSVGVALILVLAACSLETVRRLSAGQKRQPTYGGRNAYQ